MIVHVLSRSAMYNILNFLLVAYVWKGKLKYLFVWVAGAIIELIIILLPSNILRHVHV